MRGIRGLGLLGCLQNRLGAFARQELATATLSLQLCVLDHHLATAHHRDGPAIDHTALVRRVAHLVVQVAPAHGALGLGVPNRNVGIQADGNIALAFLQAIHVCMVGGSKTHKFFGREAASQQAFGEQQRQAQLQAGHAIGHFLEGRGVALGQLAAFIELVGRVVRAVDAQGAVQQALPDLVLRGLVAHRWAAAEFCAFQTLLVHVFCGQEQVLRAGLGMHFAAQLPGTANHFNRFGA